MLTFIIIVVSVIGYFLAGQVIAKAMAGKAAQLSITQKNHDVEYEWENNFDRGTKYHKFRWLVEGTKPKDYTDVFGTDITWRKTGRKRGGSEEFDPKKFANTMMALRLFWPLAIFSISARVTDKTLVEKYDPARIAARELESKKEIERLNEEIRLSEMADAHYRETGEVLDKEVFRNGL